MTVIFEVLVMIALLVIAFILRVLISWTSEIHRELHEHLDKGDGS